MQSPQSPTESHFITQQPYYEPVGNEIGIFESAWRNKLAISLRGPTGCGKTRFMEYMAWRLQLPLITVSCHDDLTASDLIGRYLITDNQTVWIDGPLTAAVRHGAILYLDEIVEARKDTMVVIHPLTDHRRVLTIDKLARILKAPAGFMLVVSYNPGYQSVLKEMKQSTRQRFVSLDFTYPPESVEVEAVATESGVDRATADKLVRVGSKVRNLTDRGLEEGVSTRLLVYAARLIAQGSPVQDAAEAAFVRTLTDDPDLQASIREVVADFF